MPGNGGIGGGSVRVRLTDDDANAPSSARATGGPNSQGRREANASVGTPKNRPIKFTFTFPEGHTCEGTVQPDGPEITFTWAEQ
jgi:hypothetical protein